MSETKTCRCGATFTRPDDLAAYNWKLQKYCSSTCRDAAGKEGRKPARKPLTEEQQAAKVAYNTRALERWHKRRKETVRKMDYRKRRATT